jgi:hypothetical protein
MTVLVSARGSSRSLEGLLVVRVRRWERVGSLVGVHHSACPTIDCSITKNAVVSPNLGAKLGLMNPLQMTQSFGDEHSSLDYQLAAY